MLPWRRLSGVTLAVVLAACGSSSSPKAAPPRVVSTSPADGTTGVPVTTTVQAVFDQSLDPATVTAASVRLQAGATLVAGSVAYDSATRTVTFTPASPLAYLTLYAARITTAVKGSNGLALEADRVFTFTTARDTVPPQVLSTSPIDLATDVAATAVVTANFSDVMDPATISATTFRLTQRGTPVVGTVTYDPGLRTATFTPDQPLPYQATCQASLTAGITDQAGNALTAINWSFTVEADTVAPELVDASPADHSTGVALDAVATATFNEPLDPTTVSSATFKLLSGASEIPGAVTYQASARIVTFTPSAPLAYLTVYTAEAGTGITDLAGNPLAAPASWSFTTLADTTPPSVTGVVPADQAADVATGSLITATFSEPLDPATLTAATFALTANGAPVTGAVGYDAATRTATFTPDQPLPYLAACQASLFAGITDLAGNPLTAFSWAFTVEADTVAPTIVDLSPADGATEVPLTTTVRVTFSEPIAPATITGSTFFLRYQSSSISASVAYDVATRVAALTPSSPLANLLAYSATVTTGVTDLAGNALAAGRTWSFTTEPDRVPPTVVSTSPAANATNVPTTTTIRVCFSEAMTATSVNGAVLVGGSPAYGNYDALSRCFLTYAVAFGSGQLVTVTVTTAAKDAAGNALAAPYTWSFRTVPDTTPPTVTGSSPVNGAHMVSRSLPSISVTFSEPMAAASLDSTTFTVTGVTGTVAMSGSQTAVFTPSGPLAAATSYTVTITTGAMDRAGNGLAAPFVFTFRTVNGAPSQVNSSTPAATRSPMLAYDTAGNAMAAWTYYTGTGNTLAWSYKPAGGSWAAEQVIDVAPEASIGIAALVPRGTGFGLLYARPGTGLYSDLVVRFVSGGTMDAGTTLATGLYGTSGLHLVAGTSTWLVAWDSTYSVNARVFSGGSWTAAQGITKSGSWDIAASGDVFHVITTDYGPVVRDTVWNSTWGTATTLNGSTGGSLTGPVVTSGPAGVAVAWTQTDTAIPATTRVLARVYAGGAWSAEQVLRSAASAAATSLMAASDGSSHLVAFAQSGAIQTATYAGGSWAAETVPGGGTSPTLLAARQAGYAVTWAAGTGYSAAVRSSTWGAATSLGTSVGSPALVGSTTGFAFAYSTSYSGASVLTYTSAWSAATTFDTGAVGYQFKLAPNGSGFALAWGVGPSLKTSTSAAGWGVATNLVTQFHPSSALDPRAAIRGSHAVVTWRQYDANSSSGWPRLFVATWNGVAWSAPMLFDSVGGDPVEVVATSANDFAVFWFSASGYARMFRRYSFATNTWAAAQTLATSQNSFQYQLTYTGSEFIALYDDYAGNTWQTTSADGAAWSAATNLGAIGWNLRMASGGGTTLLVRQSSGSASASVTASRYAVPGTWSAPTTLGYAASSNDLVLAASGAGGAAVLFDAYGGSATVGGRIYDAGAWGASTTVGSGYHPRVSGGSSAFLAAWRYSTTGPVYARAYLGGSWASAVSFASATASAYSPASTSAGQAVLVTDNPSPGTPAPTVYTISGAAMSSGGPLESTAGVYQDACLAGDPGGSALLATWTRTDPATAARVLMVLPDP